MSTTLAHDRLWATAPNAHAKLLDAGRALLDALVGRGDVATNLARAHADAFVAACLVAAPAVEGAAEAAATLFEICRRALSAEAWLADEQPEASDGDPPPSYPLEVCAVLAAKIDLAPHDEAAILVGAQLDAAAWQRLVMHWGASLTEERKRGRTTLHHQHDRAYIGEIERQRGEVTVDEFARMKVAISRGTQAAVLHDLAIPACAVTPLERTWITKVTGDSELRQALRRALVRERGPNDEGDPQ